MRRRQFVRRLSASALAAGAATKAGAEPASEAESESYDALDTEALPSSVPISWIVERFIQVSGADNPATGNQVETTALVLGRVASADDATLLQQLFDWDAYDYTGQNAFSSLFSPVSWPLEDGISPSVLDSYDVLWLTGTKQENYQGGIDTTNTAIPSDQTFYSLYGHSPFVFAVVESGSAPAAGSVVDLTGTIRHTADGDGPISSGDGGYLEIERVSINDVDRTPTSQWSSGRSASFVGLQQHPEPTLTGAKTTVDYEDNLNRPVGGSILRKNGRVLSAETSADSLDRLELDSDSHQLHVGEVLPSTWEVDDDEVEDIPVNISVVIDTSGSMSETDTGWRQNGRQLSRIAAARESAKEFLAFLRDGIALSIVEFDTRASVVSNTAVLDDSTRGQFRSDIGSLRDGGDTGIGDGLQTAYQTMENQSGRKVILLLTDGQENEAPYVSEVLPGLREQGVRVYTIGIGDQIPVGDIQLWAEQTNARALWDFDAGEIRQFFETMGVDVQDNARLKETRAMVEEGDTVEDDCQVDSSCEDVQFALTYEGSDMALNIEDPSGNELSESGQVTKREGPAHEIWTIDDPQSGQYSYTIDVNEAENPQMARTQVNGDSPISTDLFVSRDLYEQTGFVRLRLKVEDSMQRYTGATATLEIQPPGEDAEPEEITLHDNGNGADDVANDGIYSNYYHPTATGEYEFKATIEGGEYPNLQRESRHSENIETVVEEPIRPFEWDRPEDEPAGSSLLNVPFLIGGTALSAAAAGYYYLKKKRGGGGSPPPGGQNHPAGPNGPTQPRQPGQNRPQQPNGPNQPRQPNGPNQPQQQGPNRPQQPTDPNQPQQQPGSDSPTDESAPDDSERGPDR
ncbi:VWA domain-containing protein [Halovenus sp. HT40]|uniref:VWA domain-containing protein n=1 Tax=Halovenus sp. HT40 TaxID=3126691 RepID=UPI00300E81DD